MNKRGQFFLIAALVVVAIIASLAVVYNKAEAPKEDLSVYDLSSDVDFEAAQVIDSGVFKADTEEQIGKNIQNITDSYANSNPDVDIVIIYGTSTSATIIYYNNTKLGSVGISTGTFESVDNTFYDKRKLIANTTNLDSGKIRIILGEEKIEHYATLKQGQNFYIIVQKPRGSEQFVASSEDDVSARKDEE